MRTVKRRRPLEHVDEESIASNLGVPVSILHDEELRALAEQAHRMLGTEMIPEQRVRFLEACAQLEEQTDAVRPVFAGQEVRRAP